MKLKTKGIPVLIQEPIVGRITKNIDHNAEICVSVLTDINGVQSQTLITTRHPDENKYQPGVYNTTELDQFEHGDLVVVNTDGIINTLYRVKSGHNFLLFTERCNSNCLMCSQPPKDKDDTSYFFDIYKQLIPQIPKDCPELGITGGEPTLLGNQYFELLSLLQDNLPNTQVHCLTNGRSFAWPNMADKLGNLAFDKLMLGIPIYADSDDLHDYIVQAKGAFNQTMLGLYNLAQNNVRIELRIVLHKQTIPRLTKLAKFIYRNLPFVEHITFMALENQGYTPHNIDLLWIDPIDYRDELEEAISYLSDFGMNVSIYNSQLCTIPVNLWEYARKSISDWKNIYLPECSSCTKQEICGGFFASNRLLFSRGIKAFS